MGLHTELEFQMYHRVGRSPRISQSHCYGSKVEDRHVKGKSMSRNLLLKSLDIDFSEISVDNCQNSFKSTPSKPADVAGIEELKRGSIYQSSKAVRKIMKMGEFEGRKKMELSHSSETSLSSRIVYSLSQSNECSSLAQQKRSPLMSPITDVDTALASKTYIEPDSRDSQDLSFHLPPSLGYVASKDFPSDHFFEICLDSKDIKHHSSETIEKGMMEKLKFRCDQTIGPSNSGNCLLQRDTILTLHKSSSTKVGRSYSTSCSESDQSKASTKVWVNPIRRVLDPIMKSKSRQNPSVSVENFGGITAVGLATVRKNMTVCKSLLHDFSKNVHKEESGTHSVKINQHSSIIASSPAHLHGLLKLEYKHGAPFFEFSLKDLGDVLVAKTWRGHNAFNWVYTFHTLNSKRKGSSSGWGAKERHKDASMVGQMKVSCYLCSEMRKAGAFDNSMVTEFVLYDIAHARKSLPTQESSHCLSDSIKPPKDMSGGGLVNDRSMDLNAASDPAKLKFQARHASGNNDFDVSTPYPWAPGDLHPNLEIAAIVIQIPIQKRESFKDRQDICGKAHLNLFDFYAVEQKTDDIPNYMSPVNMKVVTSTATHGLPRVEEGGGPSPLLDRWRSGGGCDCGGWDMACPLTVFGNPNIQNVRDHPLENQQPLELFVQGAKEKMPALTIEFIDEGQYSVDFHAQLSTLQAFSICVAILHSAEDSTAVGQGRNNKMLQCNSLKMRLEEEVRFLIEAVAEEEKRKVTKKMEEAPPSFMLNPPFSPIGRV